MRKAILVCLFTALFVIGVVRSLQLSRSETNIQKNAIETTQGNGIKWNNTDYNSTYAQKSYPGNETLSPRIIIEYGDLAIKNNLASGVPNFTILPRIMIEYADYVSYIAFPLQPYPGPFPNDVAVLNVSSSKTVVGQTYNCSVNVTVSNNGYFPETFNATVYANTTMIGTQTVDNILNGTSTALAFAWNTTGFAYGNYTLWAYAEPVPNETNTANNNYTCSTPVHVGVPGDVSSIVPGVYDGICNMRDISYLILHFTTKPSSPNWNPNADINNDATVNMRDIQIAILNFTKQE